MNFPTVGLIDGRFRKELEDTGMGYSKEIETLKLASELGFFTLGYAFNAEEATLVGEAKLDVLICHMGLTRGGAIGSKFAEGMSLEDAAALVRYDKGRSPEKPGCDHFCTWRPNSYA